MTVHPSSTGWLLVMADVIRAWRGQQALAQLRKAQSTVPVSEPTVLSQAAYLAIRRARRPAILHQTRETAYDVDHDD